MTRPSSNKGIYGIAVVAELTGTGQQNLRLYERKGLLEPERTPGGTRRYSDADVQVLHRIVALLDEGVNLAGVRLILELEADNHQLRRKLDRLTGR
ncbi:MAG TPA: MerR family transcriptional regulator [Arthrobacter sp.]|nr:MerR family transcriptional regulator [Arthrobacter sp.]